MKIKVCGLKCADNIGAIAKLEPDYMGFIFYPKSPRYIADLDPEILDDLPETIFKTGVFVNESFEVISRLINTYHFDAVQLHGGESPEFCGQFAGNVKVLKAFGVDDRFSFDDLIPYVDSVDYFLFDTKTPAHGGSGKVFNWDILDRYQLNVPFFLSGGLSLENLETVKNIKHPQFYGVDLNSRFETEPGLKNIALLSEAFELLRNTNYEIRS